jgi:hypothetical protein
MSQFDWPISLKKLKLWKLLNIEGSFFMYGVPPLWLIYLSMKECSLFCFEVMRSTRMLQIMFLVSLESSGGGGVA